MTAYINFTSDFPKRCLDVLDMALPKASEKGREITLLLMAASASLLVPFERLKPDTEYSSHPFGDNKRYDELATRLKELLVKKFIGSELCPNVSNTWRLAKKVNEVSGDLDSWLPNTRLKPLSTGREVASTLTLIRNALAHGSIYTSGDPIRELIFVKEVLDEDKKRVGFDVLAVEHDDFRGFVRAWINFLQATDQPSEISA